MKKKKTLGIISVILPILTYVVYDLILEYGLKTDNALNMAIYCALIALVLALVSTVLGIIGIKNAKGLSIAGIILGCIGIFIYVSNISLFKTLPKFKDCEQVSEEIVKCKVNNVEIELPIHFFKEDQYKKEG